VELRAQGEPLAVVRFGNSGKTFRKYAIFYESRIPRHLPVAVSILNISLSSTTELFDSTLSVATKSDTSRHILFYFPLHYGCLPRRRGFHNSGDDEQYSEYLHSATLPTAFDSMRPKVAAR